MLLVLAAIGLIVLVLGFGYAVLWCVSIVLLARQYKYGVYETIWWILREYFKRDIWDQREFVSQEEIDAERETARNRGEAPSWRYGIFELGIGTYNHYIHLGYWRWMPNDPNGSVFGPGKYVRVHKKT